MAKQGKERIISAAFQLFLKRGYQSVSLKDIIAESQLSKGAIYHHFDSKYAIYLAALEEYYFKLLKNAAQISEDLPFRQRIRLCYEQAVNLFDTIEQIGETGVPFPIRTYFIFQLESERDETIRVRVQEAMESYRQEVSNIVQTAIHKREINLTISPETFGLQIMTMIEGIAMHYSALENGSRAFLLEKYETIIGSYLDVITGISVEAIHK